MNEVLADQIELNSLVMLANKREYLDRANKQQAAFIDQQQRYDPSYVESNGVPATAATPGSSASATEDDGSITNRSPITNYHIYQTPPPAAQAPPASPATPPVPQPTPTPSTGSKVPKWLIPAILVLLLASGAGGAAWWLATRPTPSPNTTPKNPTYSPDTTIKFS